MVVVALVWWKGGAPGGVGAGSAAWAWGRGSAHQLVVVVVVVVVCGWVGVWVGGWVGGGGGGGGGAGVLGACILPPATLLVPVLRSLPAHPAWMLGDA